MRATRKICDRGLVCLAALMLTGCSGEKPSSAPVAAAPKAPAVAASNSSAAGAASAVAAKIEPSAHRSKFTVDPKFRDPFFPKRVETGPVAQAPADSRDAAALLQAGFQGTIGSGDERLGLINNVILQAGRNSVIPLNVPGQKREVTVKVLQVLPTSVVMEILPQRQRITVTRNQR